MPLLLALCLTLLQALLAPAGAPAGRAVAWRGEWARAAVRVEAPTAERAPGDVRAVPDPRAERDDAPDRALLQARPFAPGSVAVRGDGEPGGRIAPPLMVAPRPTSAAELAAAARARTLEERHAVAARGALLPYDPTGPPIRG